MLCKFRLLFLPVLAALFLAACDSETNDSAALSDSSLQEITTALNEKNTEVAVQNEAIETEEAQTGETAVAEKEKMEETVVVEAAALPEETEQLNADAQEAIEQLIEETDIELENYVFFFTEIDEYIEIEVRENIDAEATPLVGIYRYMIETGELLASDYLTGEFIPFEKIQ